MTTFRRIELIDQLIEDNQEVLRRVNDTFLPLSDEVLLWKPEPTRWSIAECLDHLNKTNQLYLSRIQAKQERFLEKPNTDFFSSGWLGDYAVKSIQPDSGVITNRMKTFGELKPETEKKGGHQLVGDHVLSDFHRIQKEWINVMERAKDADITRIKISSALGPVIRFRLGDAFRFITAHNQRHLLQAENVLGKFRSSEIFGTHKRTEKETLK